MSPHLWEEGKSTGIEWDESRMATGFPAIDEQHKEWICRFNEFGRAILENRGVEACSDVLLFFLHYTETHFRFEENVMDQYHCSAGAMNREEHKIFQSRIHETIYKTWPSGATESEVRALRNQLSDWLVHHICFVDVKLREVADKS
jgi:hemerythrin